MSDVRPTCCEKARETDAVLWCTAWDWRKSEDGADAGWGAVVEFEYEHPRMTPHAMYGRVDFCPFCGAKLEAS